jgi:hypothetical protein
MGRSEFWSTLNDHDGKTYYSKHDSKGRVHRVSRETYEKHLASDVPEFTEDGTKSGPKYWSVGTRGKNGEVKYVMLNKVAGDKNVYRLDASSIHGDLAHDSTAMKRIGDVIAKHKALLQIHEGPDADIPLDVVYNLDSSLAHDVGNRSMALPTIASRVINTNTTFKQPFSTMFLTDLKQITIPSSANGRRTNMDVATAQQDAKQYSEYSDTFHACLDKCDYALTIQEYNEFTYLTTEKIRTQIAREIFPRLQDHWPGSDKKSAYWLSDVEGLKPLTDEDLEGNDSEGKPKQDKFNAEAKKLLNIIQHKNIYMGRSKTNPFTVKDFLKKSDGSLIYWSCGDAAYFPDENTAWLSGKYLRITSVTGDNVVPASWLLASTANAEAMANGIKKSK